MGLLFAIVTVGLVAAMATVVVMVVGTIDSQIRLIRIKMMTYVLADKIESMLVQPFSYENCILGQTSQTCRIRMDLFDRIRRLPIYGARCNPVDPMCGLIAVPEPPFPFLNYDAATNQIFFRAQIQYQGEDLAINNHNLVVNVPPEVAQVIEADCSRLDPTRPIFEGFNTDGSIRCRQLPTICPPGQFLRSVNPNSLTGQCQSFQSAVACPSTSFIGQLTWTAGVVSVVCQNRLNPFTMFPIDP